MCGGGGGSSSRDREAADRRHRENMARQREQMEEQKRQFEASQAAAEKRYQEQLPHWEYLRTQAPENLDLIHSHAQALWNAKQHQKSQELVLKGLALDAEHPNLLMLQANHLSRNGQEEEAQESYQKALAAKKAREAGAPAPQ